MNNHQLETIAAEVASSLATFELTAGAAFISTPLLYPGGSSVVVRVHQHGSRFFVTDSGLGHRETEMMGGGRLFQKIAPGVAVRFGISFDQEAFFATEAERDELVPAVTLVANASRSAVELTAYRVTDKLVKDTREIMKAKLIRAFDPRLVATDFEFRGASNDSWSFDAAVRSDNGLSLFQLVTPAPLSVHSAIARFVDVADITAPGIPQLIAVLEDRDRTSHLRLVERSAKTIELGADVPVWQRAAAA